MPWRKAFLMSFWPIGQPCVTSREHTRHMFVGLKIGLNVVWKSILVRWLSRCYHQDYVWFSMDDLNVTWIAWDLGLWLRLIWIGHGLEDDVGWILSIGLDDREGQKGMVKWDDSIKEAYWCNVVVLTHGVYNTCVLNRKSCLRKTNCMKWKFSQVRNQNNYKKYGLWNIPRIHMVWSRV